MFWVPLKHPLDEFKKQLLVISMHIWIKIRSIGLWWD